MGLGCPDEAPPPAPGGHGETLSGATGGTAAAAGATAFEAALAEIIATCADAEGQVEVRRSGSTYWEPVGVGATFRAGDWVRTGADGALRMAFRAGGDLALEPGAVAVVDALRPEGSAESRPLVAVETGVVRGRVGGDAGDLHIRAADGTSARLSGLEGGGAGAEVRVARTDEGTEVALDSGEATLGWRGAEETLSTGAAAEIGHAGVRRIPLLRPPAGTRPHDDLRVHLGSSLRLRWSAVQGASGYRVQLAKDPQFQSPEAEALVRTTGHLLEPADEGALYWRLATRDAKGRFGPWGPAHRLFVEAEPPADLLREPRPNARLGHPGDGLTVRFAWAAGGEQARYRLVVARGRNLSRRRVVDLQLARPEAVIETLTPGLYVWGVYREDQDGRPIFLKARRLTVRRTTLEAPEVIRDWGVSGD